MSDLKASTVTEQEMKNILSCGVLDNAPRGATHYDMFWCQFLRKCGEILRFYEDGMWKVSNHKDGVSMLTNGECINLWTMKIEAPNKQAEDKQMEWIKTEDRLPESNDRVLCFCNDIVSSWQEVLDSYECPEYGGHEWSFLNGDEYPCIVTHWMPLPEPPKD